MDKALKIGELAEHTGCLVETIRFYERKGLLNPPVRSENNYRVYSSSHVERLQFIRNCRSLDMTLEEIRSLLALRDQPNQQCGDVNALLDAHIGHVDERIEALKTLQQQLMQLRSVCIDVRSIKDCKILSELAATDIVSPANLGSHTGGCH